MFGFPMILKKKIEGDGGEGQRYRRLGTAVMKEIEVEGRLL